MSQVASMAAKRKRNAAAKAKSKSSPTQATPPKQKEKKLVDEGEQLTSTALSDVCFKIFFSPKH